MNPLRNLWLRWRSLRLPWRKSFLVGHDLSGNTYWEFKDALNSTRLRRIVRYNRKIHLGDVEVSPQWHQWLRYVRYNPPSIAEQQQDIIRQLQIKQLAQLADERWASKPSYLDQPQNPQQQQPAPATAASDATLHPGDNAGAPGSAAAPKTKNNNNTTARAGAEDGAKKQKAEETNPWKKAGGGPSENWQPESWTPTASQR